MYNAKVLDFDIVLDWMVNPKVDPRCDRERPLAIIHDDTDSMLSEGSLARQ